MPTDPPPPGRPDEADLLHLGGPPGRWGNLGLWPDPPQAPGAYACAARALATLVAKAAGLRAGDRVLGIACGRGEELRLWLEDFGAAQVVGIEPHPAWAAEAAARLSARPARVVTAAFPAGLADLVGVTGFDRVLCVDAAYHLGARDGFVRAVLRHLRPGGTLAFTDLVVDPDSPWASPAGRWPAAWRAMGHRAGIDVDAIGSVDSILQGLADAGAEVPRAKRLDAEVLDGFVRFAALQSRAIGRHRLRPAWWRVAGTAACIPALRRHGVGYALFSARAPAAPATLSPPSPPSTA